MQRLIHTVAAAQEGLRLDTCLRKAWGFSTALLQTLKATDGVRVEGAFRYMNQKVRDGERIEVQLPPESPTDAPLESGPVAVLYEDETLLALDKPPGMLVHPSLSVHHGTLLGAALGYLAAKGAPPVLHPVHRLDRDTSGCVLFARHGFAKAHLTAQLRAGQVEKRYQALAFGPFPAQAGEIDLPIGEDPDNRLLRRIDPQGRPARTRYQVLATQQVCHKTVSRLALFPETGRTHQLRLHCLALGAPLLGDPQYTLPEARALSEALRLSAQCLHAGGLGFVHPVTGKWMEVISPPRRLEAIFNA